MKRIIFLVLMCFILSMFSVISAAEYTGSETEMTGVSVSASDYKTLFSGNPNSRTITPTITSLVSSTIMLSNINIEEGVVSVTAHFQNGDTEITLPIEGTLGASYKTQQNINSAVIQVDEPVNGYEILLFEIFNDTAPDNLLLDYINVGDSLAGTPHIKLYLKDSQENLYLFESEMPYEFSTINASQYDLADKHKDMLWVLPYVDVTVKELPLTDQLMNRLGMGNQTYALNSFSTWTYPTVQYLSYNTGAEFIEHYSVPYVKYKHTNVSSDSTWTASFNVSERMETSLYGNKYTYYGNNIFQYRDISIAFACGDRTTFIRTHQEGRVIDYDRFWFWEPTLYEAGMDIAITALQKVVSALPSASTFASVQTLINTVTTTQKTVELGSASTDLIARHTVAVGEDLTGYYLDTCTDYNGEIENGHYFTFQPVVQFEDTNGNASTVGALKVTFDIYRNDTMEITPVTKTFQLSYSTSAS